MDNFYYNITLSKHKNIDEQLISELTTHFGKTIMSYQGNYNIVDFYTVVYYASRGLIDSHFEDELPFDAIELILDHIFGIELKNAIRYNTEDNEDVGNLYDTLFDLKYPRGRDIYKLTVNNDNELLKLRIEQAIKYQIPIYTLEFLNIVKICKIVPDFSINKWFEYLLIENNNTSINEDTYNLLVYLFPSYKDSLLLIKQ